MLEKIFKLKQNNTSLKQEAIAGLTTFLTMAYILFVNPRCWLMLVWIMALYLLPPVWQRHWAVS